LTTVILDFPYQSDNPNCSLQQPLIGIGIRYENNITI
jgi:hypothetical protein